MKTVLCLAAIVAFWAVANAAIDCNRNRCGDNGHQQTVCLYPNPNPAQACGKVRRTGLTNAEKKEVVDRHNALRQHVASGAETAGAPGPQPPASNMQNLQWDDELAEVAQRWANQCHFGHDKCRDVDRFVVGQNVGKMSTSGTENYSPKNVIQMWYDEVKKFNKNLVSRLTTIQDVGHYTQLVWAKTNRVGCGQVKNTADGWNSYYLVCNYGPAGNYMGEPVYEIRR